MRLRSTTLLLLTLSLAALLGGGAAALADTVKVDISGAQHEVEVPAGWSTRTTQGGVEFLPPAGRTKRLRVAVVGIDLPPGTNDAASVARALADNERKSKPWLEAGATESIDFVGAPGALVVMAGTPKGGEMEAEMFVVAIANGKVYMFTATGSYADVRAMVDDLAAIIGGVRVAGAKVGGVESGGASAGDDGDELERALGKKGPKDPKDQAIGGGGGGGFGKNGPPRSEDWLLVDQAFGLRLKAPVLRRWRLDLAEDEYQLERTDEQPHAVVAIRRVKVKNKGAYEKQAKKLGRSTKTKFAGAEALLVERKSGDTVERHYHLIRGDWALVLEFRVVGRSGDAGVDARVFEVEQAVVLDEKGAAKWSDGAIELTTYGGVKLATAAEWTLTGVGPGRANFRNDRGVEVEVRVRPWPKASDPFKITEEELTASCGKDAYTRAEAAVVGARQAARYRCAGKGQKQAEVVLVAEGRGNDGGRVWVRVTAKHAKKKAKAADAESAEFGAYVTLPH